MLMTLMTCHSSILSFYWVMCIHIEAVNATFIYNENDINIKISKDQPE